MKSPTKSLTAIIIVTVLSCVHYSCSCSNCGKKEEAVVPASGVHMESRKTNLCLAYINNNKRISG